jgi:small subunit ribosomal protein S16
MVRIRLRRVGLKHQPSYRIVVADKEAPRDGRFLEIIGFYNPRTDPSTIDIKEDRLFDWMSKGAQPSESLVKLLNSVGASERFNRFKAGEPVETLVAESKVIYAKLAENQKTR